MLIFHDPRSTQYAEPGHVERPERVVLLIIGALPFWEEIRHRRTAQAALRGVNAAVVGLLLAALYNPIWTTGITKASDFALA